MKYLSAFLGITDSGKTTLTDRICTNLARKSKEQITRGITVNVGYGCICAGKNDYYVLDTPGHDKFKLTVFRLADQLDLIFYVIDSGAYLSPKKYQYMKSHLSTLFTYYPEKIVPIFNKVDLLSKDQLLSLVEDLEKSFAFQHEPAFVSAIHEHTFSLLEEVLSNLESKTAYTNSSPSILFRTLKSFDVNRADKNLKLIKGGVLGGICYVNPHTLLEKDLYINDEFLKKRVSIKIKKVMFVYPLSNNRFICTLETYQDPTTYFRDKRKNTLLWAGPEEYIRTLVKVKLTPDLLHKVKRGDNVHLICEGIVAQGVIRRDHSDHVQIALQNSGLVSFNNAKAMLLKTDSSDRELASSCYPIGVGKICDSTTTVA